MKTKSAYFKRGFLMAALLVGLTACGGGGDGSGDSDQAWSFPIIYVVDYDAQSIMAWDSAASKDGNLASDFTVSGGNTGIEEALGIEYDSRSDTVFIVDIDGDAIRIFDDVVAHNGNVAASRTVSGPSTLLQYGYDVALDESRDLLYATTDEGVLIFDQASTIDGNIAPVRVISGANFPVSGSDHRLALDASNDRLFISDFSGNQILVYDHASTRQGNVAPDRTVTGVADPWGIALDGTRDILYVNRYNDAIIDVFDSAGAIDGAATPSRSIISTAVAMGEGCDLAIDTAGDTLYATTGTSRSVLIWHNASSVTGNIAPDRTITGANTGFLRPVDIIFAE